MDNQAKLALLLVKELRKQKALEDVICEHGIETVRECSCCHMLMNEGWIYHDYYTYCSNGCLLHDNPNEDINELQNHANGINCAAYWTSWEG